MMLLSKDSDMGFPGNLTVHVRYALAGPAVTTVGIYLLKIVVDDVLIPGRFDLFGWIALAYLSLSIVENLLGGADRILSTWLSQRFLVDLRLHAKTWDFLRKTRMPAVRLDLGYLTNDGDATRLGRPEFRDTVAEAVVVAIQRFYLAPEVDPHTLGTQARRERRHHQLGLLASGTPKTSQRLGFPTVLPSARSASTVRSTPSPKPIPDKSWPPS